MQGIPLIQDLAILLVVAGVVGWLCQRLGLSVIVGFLAAGLLVGPHSPALALVGDVGRVGALAELGLVFLMFSIGLQLSLRRLQRLGVSLFLAAFAGAIVVFQTSRLLALALGWSGREGLFLAAMLMVSSTAIISRILHENGINHERPGQLALGVSVLEDVLAVVMLVLLDSVAHLGQVGATRVPESLLMLGAFVAVASIAGLLLVPWLLKRMNVAADEELQTLGMAALLFGLAVVAHGAGFSLALGAYLLGAIVAETPYRHQVERTFTGLRGVFSAVFFVAIGMQIDVRELGREAGLIAGIAAFTVVLRPAAVTAGLVLIGTPLKDGLRTALTVTPLGEFTFIIAQLGVTSAVVPARFFPLAVGVSLLTALAAPLLTRRSEQIAGGVVARLPRGVTTWLRVYFQWLEKLRRRRARSRLWQLSRKRIVQVGVGMLFVTGLVLFSGQLFAVVDDGLGRHFSPKAVQLGFWIALTLVILAPLVAIWRNLSAMALLYAEISTKGQPRAKRLRPLIEAALKFAAGVGLFAWLTAILPVGDTTWWLLAVSGVVAVVTLLVLRRKLILWHSEMEIEIMSTLETGDGKMSVSAAPWLQPHTKWNLRMVDCTLPDLADCQGKRIAELDLRARLGCTIVGIERQGFMIPLPSPDTVLYPQDKVLLMGTAEQVRAGRTFLGGVSGLPVTDSVFGEVRMESIVRPEWSRAAGRALGQSLQGQDHGVQIAGVHRGGLRILNPGAQEVLRVGDEILVLGTPVQIAEFSAWVRERPEESPDVKAD
ncbi:MAG: cation:proton antiporter [Opitutaceae bacterium]|nr:cation:proton antiporter [Opitutaceae bacterium]